MPIKAKKPKKIVEEVMKEYKKKELNVGKSKKKVKSRKQAIAIALSEAGLSKKNNKPWKKSKKESVNGKKRKKQPR